jgi:hypothetical protein
LPGGTEENHEKLRSDSRSSSRDLNPEPTEYDADRDVHKAKEEIRTKFCSNFFQSGCFGDQEEEGKIMLKRILNRPMCVCVCLGMVRTGLNSQNRVQRLALLRY